MKAGANDWTMWQGRVLALLRIVAGYMFLMHGSGKLFGIPHIGGYEHVNLLSLDGMAGIIEFTCGTLVMVGWFTRGAAFVASGMMAVAYFIAHATLGSVLVPPQNAGELSVLYSFVFLLLFVAGPGAWSIDGRLGNPQR